MHRGKPKFCNNIVPAFEWKQQIYHFLICGSNITNSLRNQADEESSDDANDGSTAGDYEERQNTSCIVDGLETDY
ncbi:hypothetical protein OESDEN_06209 [Oesophagostomum dentatum]|uniref:Uncharacterized protein n=1 Tax=Oesophagostomum dentatum TaxID=61180 RepID=A0A0B1TEQ9_OESDE|nr:hypothetical protein OESDEN_06209 [Oesophagostomum dentatum]